MFIMPIVEYGKQMLSYTSLVSFEKINGKNILSTLKQENARGNNKALNNEKG
mgnify:CR=1 FL=1